MKKKLSFCLLLICLFFTFNPVQGQDVVNDLLARINNLRASLGLSPYTLNAALNAAAQNQAQWMVNTGEVSHTQENGSRPVDRANANGYRSSWVSENIYMGGIATANDAWNFWINSSIHYAGLTNVNYRDIGIASASGTHGYAFVLVFGNPTGSFASTSNSSSNSNNNSADPAAAPLPILGYDEVGNIRYQLQEGETLGDVLLLFGYTWDDLAGIMELNALTDADIRSLDVGQEILVPPHAGTWTPTPLSAESTSEITPPAEQSPEAITPELTESQPSNQASPTPNSQASGVLPTPSGSDSFILSASPTNTELPLEQIAPPAVFSGESPTPSPSPTIEASPTNTLQIRTLPPSNTVASYATPITAIPLPSPSTESSIPMWLIGAIVVQVGVLGYASIEFLRRLLQKK